MSVGERSLQDRLNLIEAQKRGEYGYEVKADFAITTHIRFSWHGYDLDIGGYIDFRESDLEVAVSPTFYLRLTEEWTYGEARSKGEGATPAEPIVHETGDLSHGYLTVHYQNGNYEWFELNFRVRDGVAYLASKVRVERPRSGRGWIPPEVKDAIHAHHTDLEIRNATPPWME